MTRIASRELAAPIAIAALAAAAYATLFYPGAMGFDAAYQWWQARGGETSNIHGVLMTALWRISDAVSAGPALLFLLQLVLFWCGLAAIAQALPVRFAVRLALPLFVAAAPVCFVLFSAIGSDALLMAVLCCCVAILLRLRAHQVWMFAVLAALLLTAALLRKNALPAVLPLLFVALQHCWNLSVWRSAGIALLATFAMHGASLALDCSVERRVTVFPATALWDLAAISIDADDVLLPPATHGRGLDVADLRQAFLPYANTSLFARTHAGMMQPFLTEDDPLNGIIRDAWFAAIAAHPGAYLAHRWRVTQALFGSKPAEWPRELVYFDGVFQYRDNPPVVSNESAAHATAIVAFESVRHTAWFAAWPYLAMAVFAALLAWRRRSAPQAAVALATIASGLFYALPLPLIAPSAELRYLGWTCLAAVLGLALASTARRD